MQSLLPPTDPLDQPTIDVADDLYRNHFDGHVNREVLRETNRWRGTDVATALLYLHFYHQLAGTPAIKPPQNNKPWMLAIVPGAFYREHPEIGGDGRALAEVAKSKGWNCQLIATESLGTLEENASSIIRFIHRHSNTHQILLASFSKGTADMTAAARREPAILDHVCGWVSVSGLPRGTMMADWLLDRWRLRLIMNVMCWRRGTDKQAVRDLRHRRISIPKHFFEIPCIHFAGFPLQRHLSNWRSRLWHRRFRPIGPNDSVVLLEDLFDLPGTVIPIWGADHYLKSDWNFAGAVGEIVHRLTPHSPQVR